MNTAHSSVENTEKKKHVRLLKLTIVVYIWSGIFPISYLVWFLNSIPAIIFAGVMIFTYRRFKFTTFVYFMIFLHLTVLLIGARYSYQLNPLFNYLTEVFDLSRNYFDRVGHYAQGLIPALMAKEMLLRMGYIHRCKMLNFIILSISLAISAFYELTEFVFAHISNFPVEFVLAYQGDVWDSHYDMLMALLGALTALIVLGPLHDRYISRM